MDLDKEPKDYEEWLRKYHGIPRQEALLEKIYYSVFQIIKSTRLHQSEISPI